MEREKENLTSEVVEPNEKRRKVKAELIENTKICEDQLIRLNSKQLESKKEISALKRLTDDLRAQVSEKEGMIMMLQVSLSTNN